MKLFARIVSNEILFFLITTLAILTLNLTPFFAFLRHTPPDRQFSMVHNNIQDFYFYQALMQQGASGSWLTTDPFTLEPSQPSIIFAYFLWLGKVSSFLSIPFPVMYHLTRVICGVLAGAMAYILLKIIKLPYRRLAYFFFLFASPFLHEIPTDNGIQQFSYMYWWTGIDAIRRFAYLPHHVFGSLFLIINIIALLKFVKTRNNKWMFLSLVCALLLGFIHPPSLFIILLALPVSVTVYVLIHFKRWQMKLSVLNKEFPVIHLVVYWIIGVLLMFLMVSQTNKGFPWSQYIAWEKNIQFPLDKELVGALGILVPFALFGGLFALQTGQFQYIFIVCWLFVPFLLIPFALKMNISNIRLIQGTPYLPLSILAVIGIKAIEKMIAKRWVVWVTFALFLVFTIPTLFWSMNDQMKEYWNIWSNVYLDKRLFPAFDFINNHYSNKTNVMTTFYTGNYLSAFTHTNSFMGHFGYTFNREKKEKEADEFYKNNMMPDKAKQFLLNSKITLVFQGVEERPLYPNGYLYPDILKAIYEKDGIIIYEVKK
jgi:hypothetical protein